jgi:membrane protein
LIALARLYVRHLERHDTTGLAAELAFRFMFATFPFVLFLAALGAFVASWLGVADPTARVVAALGDNIPSDLVGPVTSQLEKVLADTEPAFLSVGALVTLYSAAGGINALMKAMNRAFGVRETRSLPGRVALSMALTILGGLGIVISVAAVVGGTLVTRDLADRVGIGGATWTVLSLLRWPIAFAVLLVAIGALYRYASCVRPPWRWALAGSAAFAVAWLGVTYGFGVYVSQLGHFDATYGALGGIIVLMLWYYLSAIILVGAAELTAVFAERFAPETLESSVPEPIGVPPRSSGEAGPPADSNGGQHD